MKVNSAILAMVIAVTSIAFVTPEGYALPPSKAPGGYNYAKQRTTVHHATGSRKTIGIAARGKATRLRSYSERLRTPFVFRRGR